MELKDLLGADYKDGMTAEEITAALANKNFVTKEVFDKTASDLAAIKRDNEAIKRDNDALKGQSQTAEEKLNAALAQAEQLGKDYTMRMNTLEVERIFAEGGMKREEYSGFLGAIVSEDAEKSKSTAQDILKMMNARIAAREQSLKNELQNGSPKPNGQKPSGELTKEAYDKLSITEKMKLKAENPELFKSLNKNYKN